MATLICATPALAQAITRPGSSSGASSGSAGQNEDEGQLIRNVKSAQKSGPQSRAYMESLIELGMFYNRQGAYVQGQKSLSKALTVIDGGALKPTPGSVEEKEPTITHGPNGTVSATINKPASPYEDVLEQLLPALVESDLHSDHLKEGEIHVKRFIAMAQANRIHRVPNLMFAYNQYAEILNRMHRTAEAQHYRAEADKINSSIKGI